MREGATSDGSGMLVTRPSSAHVLVVDADAGTASTLGAVLRHDGWNVRVVSSGEEALKALAEQQFDLLLADLDDNDPNGQAVLAQAQTAVPAITVVVMTSYATLESALRALRRGVYDYLVKPVDVDELRNTLARALERRRLQRELAARVRELEAAHAAARDFNTRLQEQVDHATAELRQKVEELDEANRQLKVAQEQHDRFVAMVAHEMRGPLNPIINYAQLAKRPTLQEGALGRYMDSIVEHAFRLNRMVDDLQTATRLSTGRFSLRIEPFDLTAAVGELVDQFAASVRERRFVYEHADAPVTIDADRDRIVQAVRNLIDNAVKYSVEDGAIEVRIDGDEQTVTIAVGDYGAGISDTDMKRIFEPFIRGEKGSDSSGSGLGLFITRGIIAEHHGTLNVANRGGATRVQGAVFTITLPRRQTSVTS
ncbi:MAG TPA: ATP-binding protein [Ktedonobacterales bacterium]|nr:ATP-binding protein [Ktedonobacterales bacterium]